MNPIAIALITLGSGVSLFALGTSKAAAAATQPRPRTPPKVPIRALPPPAAPPPPRPPSTSTPARKIIELDPVIITARPPSSAAKPATKPAPPKPPPAPSASAAAKPASKLPAKRPFGDQPLDVEADASNYIPEHRAELTDSAPANAIPATAATVKPATTTRAPSKAAQELYSYVVPLISAGRGDVLGTKGAPNDIVKAAQRDMKITADGIYGDKTRARGKELLGREFPPRAGTKIKAATPASAPIAKPAPPPPASPPAITNAVPASRGAVEAARFLFDFATQKLREGRGDALGVKGKPSQEVLAAQRDMGGITADGMYGPATRERGKKLLNKTFPARV